MNTKLESFLHSISPKGKIEYSTISDGGCKVVDYNEAVSNKSSNIYFLGGVRDGVIGRAKDDDVEFVSYIRIDIDVLNQCDELETEEDVKEFAIPHMMEIIKEHSLLSTWSYVIFSGRGAHFYYCGLPIKADKEQWRLANDRIYTEWDKHMPSSYCCDQACSNIGRIMRMPGTVNQKNGATCSIVAIGKENSPLFTYVPALANAQRKAMEEAREKRRQEQEEKMKAYGNLNDDNNIHQLIKDIPAYQLSQMLLPQFKYTGGRYFSNGKGGNTAFFYSEQYNCIINGGSRHYNWGDANSGWNSFELVKRYYNWTSRETFTFFRKLINKH